MWLSQSATAMVMPEEREEQSTRAEVGRLKPLGGKRVTILHSNVDTITISSTDIITITSWRPGHH
jgi:hypothetical protein